MNPLRIGLVLVALAAAGLVGYFTFVLLPQQTSEPTEQPPAVPAARVLVANQNLPAGTVLLSAETAGPKNQLRWQEWPEEALHQNWVVLREGEDPAEKRKDVGGAVVKRGFVANEPITFDRLVKKGETGYMSAALTPGMRAVSVAINPTTAVSGFIVPGSRVDLVLTERWQEADPVTGKSSTRHVSETILEDIKVLAIDQRLDDLDTNAVVGKTATVEVTPKEAEKIAVAKSIGQLSLVLRSLTPVDQTVESTPFTSELEVSKYLSRDQPGVAHRVLVAKHDLKAGMLLTDADLEWRLMSPDASTEGLLVQGRFNVAGIRGGLLTSDFRAGEPIRTEDLLEPGAQGFLTAALAPGMRAISLAVTAVSGVSGYIAPGDRVDVVLTHSIADKSPNPPLTPRKFSETILKNVRVLAIEQQVDESSGKPVVGKTATLELTPKQAETALLAGSMGALSLTLRGRQADAIEDPSAFTSDLEISRAAWELIRGFNRYGPAEEVAEAPVEEGGESVAEVPPPPPPSRAAAPAPQPQPSVDGGSRVKVKVYRSVGVSSVSVTR